MTRLKSSEKNLTNELIKSTEKYISLSQEFVTFISKAEGLMDQLEETMSKLPLFKYKVHSYTYIRICTSYIRNYNYVSFIIIYTFIVHISEITI